MPRSPRSIGLAGLALLLRANAKAMFPGSPEGIGRCITRIDRVYRMGGTAATINNNRPCHPSRYFAPQLPPSVGKVSVSLHFLRGPSWLRDFVFTSSSATLISTPKIQRVPNTIQTYTERLIKSPFPPQKPKDATRPCAYACIFGILQLFTPENAVFSVEGCHTTEPLIPCISRAGHPPTVSCRPAW
jgi:hypothetical protein